MKLDTLKNSFGDLYTQLLDQKCCEIIVNCKEEIYYEASGKIHRFEGNTDEVSEMLKAMAGLAEIKITEETTNLRFNIGNIAISASTPKVSRKGFCFNLIKAISPRIMNLTQLEQWDAIRSEGADILRKALKEENKSILVSGGVGAGAYTLVEALMDEIPKNYRVVTIEQNPMMPTNNPLASNLVCSTGSRSELSKLVEAASTMRGDYVVISELFGKEAFQFTELLREGHDGIAHVKGSNVFDALKRLEDKILIHPEASYSDAKYAISEAFDLVVYQERLNTGERKITTIAELELVDGEIRLNVIYRD
jgi:Flp pilus assembly CpaF family ATPase